MGVALTPPVATAETLPPVLFAFIADIPLFAKLVKGTQHTPVIFSLISCDDRRGELGLCSPEGRKRAVGRAESGLSVPEGAVRERGWDLEQGLCDGTRETVSKRRDLV